ncbi:MAG TPA: AI-2E family transporter [Thermoanaerobaculia bacterium]|nr:AI-2E family transporter [Thermoanaerobaculia bacterium]
MDQRAPSPAATLRVVAIVFGVLIALRFLWIAHAIFIVAFLGIVAGLAITAQRSSSSAPQKALGVIALFVVMQQLEGNVITPLVLERRLDVPPVLTVVAVAAMSMVFGVLGMLIAEPLLAATLVVTKMLYVQDVVGDDVEIGKHDS